MFFLRCHDDVVRQRALNALNKFGFHVNLLKRDYSRAFRQVRNRNHSENWSIYYLKALIARAALAVVAFTMKCLQLE